MYPLLSVRVNNSMKKIKIGLVLGGGGARGLAHIGVLQVLQAYGINVDIIAGTSMGAIVGAVYAQHPDADFVERKFRDFLKSDKYSLLSGVRFRKENVYEPEHLLQQFSREIKRRVVINMAAHRKSLLKAERLTTFLEYLVEDSKIENFTLPFACTAVDLNSGDDVIFKNGDIYPALAASAAIPGFLPPVESNGRLLVDGSVTNNFPIDMVREMGADIVLAVNVSSTFDIQASAENVVDIILRSNAAATKKINTITLRSADYVVTPPIGKVHWAEFEEIDFLIEKGKAEAQRSVAAIRELINKNSSLIGRWDRWLMKKVKNHMTRSGVVNE